jgi:hypothetical protein
LKVFSYYGGIFLVVIPDISILDWIKHNPNVGTLGLLQFGLPGTGKSNLSTGLIQKCMNQGEFLVMPGDRFCEWRHFPNHPKFPTKMRILVPEGVNIHYHKLRKDGLFTDVNLEDLDIFKFIDKKHRMLVIFDQHLPLAQRVFFWGNIFEQLLNRIVFVDIPFILFFHEAGVYFDEGAEGDQWKAIRDFSSIFVEGRKALIRPVLLSQLESEIKSTIRKKCTFQIIRKSFLSRNYPPKLRKAAPFTPLHKYHLVYGGIYIRNNETNKYYENPTVYKMIPRVSFIRKESLESQPNKSKSDKILNRIIAERYNELKSIRKVGKELGLSTETIHRRLKTVKSNASPMI